MSKFPDMIRAMPLVLGCLAAASAAAEPLGLGREATPEEIAAWDIDIRPDGQGLPEGSGDVMTGEVLYTDYCSSCHGVFGEGEGRWPVLMGGFATLESARPVKTIGSYWPYASTVWDYVHRAMPFGAAQSLTDDEVYAVTAYLLYLNDLVDEDFVLDRESFAALELPNEDGFFLDDRPATELELFSRDVCMTDCKEDVEITMRAAVLDVTPETEGAALDAGDSGVADTTEALGDAANVEDTAIEEMASVDAATVAEGESLFRQCQGCHEVGADAENRIGPHLNGIVGREAAAVDDFRYSAAMQAAADEGLVWSVDNLRGFLTDPRGYLEGTKMVFRGLPEDDLTAMLAYLGALDAEG